MNTDEIIERCKDIRSDELEIEAMDESLRQTRRMRDTKQQMLNMKRDAMVHILETDHEGYGKTSACTAFVTEAVSGRKGLKIWWNKETKDAQTDSY